MANPWEKGYTVASKPWEMGHSVAPETPTLDSRAATQYSDVMNSTRPDYDINPSTPIVPPTSIAQQTYNQDATVGSTVDSIVDAGRDVISHPFEITTHALGQTLDAPINLAGDVAGFVTGTTPQPFTMFDKAADEVAGPLTTNSQREAASVLPLIVGEKSGAGERMATRKAASSDVAIIKDANSTMDRLADKQATVGLDANEQFLYDNAQRAHTEASQRLGVSENDINRAALELSIDKRLNDKGAKLGVGKTVESSDLPKKVFDVLGVEKTRTADVMSKIPGIKPADLKESRVNAVKQFAGNQIREMNTTMQDNPLKDDLVQINKHIADGEFGKARDVLQKANDKYSGTDFDQSYVQAIEDSGVNPDMLNRFLDESDILIKRGEAAKRTKTPKAGSTILNKFGLPTLGANLGGAVGYSAFGPIGGAVGAQLGGAVGGLASPYVKRALNSPLTKNVGRGLERDLSVATGTFDPTLRSQAVSGYNRGSEFLNNNVARPYSIAGSVAKVGNDTQAPQTTSESTSTQSTQMPWQKGYNVSQTATGGSMEMPKGSQVGDVLYNAFAVPETGGEKDPWIRTRVEPKAGELQSSAAGPVQITGTRVADYLRQHGDELPADVKQFAKDFADVAKSTLHAPKGSGFGHGEAGLFKSEKARDLYTILAKKMLEQTYKDNGRDLGKTIRSWRGVADAPYEAKVISNIRPL